MSDQRPMTGAELIAEFERALADAKHNCLVPTPPICSECNGRG
jgi:hypothetical protein